MSKKTDSIHNALAKGHVKEAIKLLRELPDIIEGHSDILERGFGEPLPEDRSVMDCALQVLDYKCNEVSEHPDLSSAAAKMQVTRQDLVRRLHANIKYINGFGFKLTADPGELTRLPEGLIALVEDAKRHPVQIISVIDTVTLQRTLYSSTQDVARHFGCTQPLIGQAIKSSFRLAGDYIVKRVDPNVMLKESTYKDALIYIKTKGPVKYPITEEL